MMINFEENKRKVKEKQNKERVALAKSIAETDIEAAVLGAIMRETGSTEICGIDYRLQQQYCEEQLQKHQRNMEGMKGNI